MEIVKKILESEHFTGKPPILIDIGASGEINRKWKMIAPYSICIAFDADDREFHITEETGKLYRKLISFNRIVSAESASQTDFYLTKFPFCSSLLKPDSEKLQPWVFSDLFKVEKKISMPAITLSDAVQQAGIASIDWFKTDTQGTDLRLFSSLSPQLSAGVLAAELEPGIIDAYQNEDKLYSVMELMRRESFWLSSMDVKGTQRLGKSYVPQIGEGATRRILRKSPGWAEVTYLREPASIISIRQYLLLYVFAILEKQYGFALELADLGLQRFSDELFKDCRQAILKKLAAEKIKVPIVILKRQLKKLFSNIND